jgi:hypothetical protein
VLARSSTAASALVSFFFLACAVNVWGQNQPEYVATEPNPDILELDAFAGVSLFSGVNQGQSEKLVNGGTVGGRAAYNFSRHFSIEANYNFMVNNVRLVTAAPSTLSSVFGDRIHSFAIDPVYHLSPRGARLRPYLTAGLGPSWFAPSKQARTLLAVNTSTELAFNYGGGVKVHLSPHLGLRLDARGIFEQNPTFSLADIPKAHLNGMQATLGLLLYFWQPPMLAAPAAAPPPKPKPTLQPLNPGDMSGASGQLCQGRVFTLHATATDPAGHTLAYAWKANGMAVGTNNPDLSFTPNNAGDFQFEVEVSDPADPARAIRIGPKTLAIQDYVSPRIAGVTASPNVINITGDPAAAQTVILAADVAASPCGGNLTYKWTVSEGSLTNDAGPSAVFNTSSLGFDSGVGQTKAVTALVTATDETGRSASQTATITVNYPAQYKRLADVVFARNSARVNNCGKRILIEQAAPQAGTAFDILLVGHRTSDESASLDRQRLLASAAVLIGNHGTCANLDLSQVRISAVGTDQTSPADLALCGTSNFPPTAERRGAAVGEADKERRVEVYLVPKGSQILPSAEKNAELVPLKAVEALGCPQ